MGSALVGLGAMAAAVIVAILLGRRLSRPIQAIAGQASRVADFELDGMMPLPRSRVLELDNQASAFNAMLIGLRASRPTFPARWWPSWCAPERSASRNRARQSSQ